MPAKTKSRSPHQRIVVGLPNLQEQLRMVDRLSRMAAESDLTRLDDLASLLSELYAQLQHQKQVTIYRFGNRGLSKPAGDTERS